MDCKKIKRGLIFFYLYWYYRVEAWDDTDQMWICTNLSTGIRRYFEEEKILGLL